MDGGAVARAGSLSTRPPAEVSTDHSDRSGQTASVPKESGKASSGTSRHCDGLWYPPSAYLNPPEVPPPPPPPAHASNRYSSQPDCSYHSVASPYTEQWMYHVWDASAGAYCTTFCPPPMIPYNSGPCYHGYGNAGQVVFVPIPTHSDRVQQLGSASTPHGSQMGSSCYWSGNQGSRSHSSCVASSSIQLSIESGSHASDLTPLVSPSSRASSLVELAVAEDWGSLTSSIFQNVMPRLAESDVKTARLVCRHWQAEIDHNLEQLTPNTMMSKLIVKRFPNLKALHLTNCSFVRNRDLMIIAESGLRLHTLTLGDDSSKPWVTNKGIACISNITTLTCLNLQDCTNVTNNGMLALSKLSILEALSLKGCQKLTNSGIGALQGNTALTSLNLFGCLRVADKCLLSLSNLNLVTLTLGCTRVKDEGLAYLAKMTSLQELHFEKEEMTDAGIKTLSSLTNLQSLALRDCGDVSGDSLSALIPQLPNLMSLDLYKNFSIDDSQLSKCLEFLGSVTHLDLRGTFVTEDGLQELTRLSSLQKLCLAPAQNAEVWGEYMCVISNLTQLTSLTINSCQLISFPLAKSLRQLKMLQELDLSDEANLQVEFKPPVNPAAVDVMATITSLTSIDLSRRPVHEDHLSVLAERLPRLHMLIIVGCPVLSSEVQALQRRFPELTIHRKPLPDVSCSASDHGSSTG